ncbi:hypothetical protein MOSE0_H04676 [Monosporozyma servazzii]
MKEEEENKDRTEEVSPRSSTSNNDTLKPVDKQISVITSDDIRPDWKAKLKKERQRLAKRAANAEAIHVSNQLVDPDYSTRQSSNSELPTPSSPHGSNRFNNIDDLEDDMVKQAIKLSLEDQRKAGKNK